MDKCGAGTRLACALLFAFVFCGQQIAADFGKYGLKKVLSPLTLHRTAGGRATDTARNTFPTRILFLPGTSTPVYASVVDEGTPDADFTGIVENFQIKKTEAQNTVFLA